MTKELSLYEFLEILKRNTYIYNSIRNRFDICKTEIDPQNYDFAIKYVCADISLDSEEGIIYHDH